MKAPWKYDRGYYSPYWLLAEDLSLPPDSVQEPDPTEFENNTSYRMRLIYLSFTSPWDEATASIDTLSRWHREVNLEIGKTGCSDQNLVRGSISTLATPPTFRRPYLTTHLDDGCAIWLPRPFQIPRDAGLQVTARNRAVVPAGGNPTNYLIRRVSFIARGFDEAMKPVILAGTTDDTLLPDADAEMDDADLMNRGKGPIWIDRLCFTNSERIITGIQPDGSATLVGYNVNPTEGQPWMPTAQAYPVGNITPLAVPQGFAGSGPRAVMFPPETYLDPRQRLSVMMHYDCISAQETDALKMNVCLFGELEVC